MRTGLLVVSLAAVAMAPASAQERKANGSGFAAKDVDRFRALVKTSDDEALWDQIPWITSLWEARMRAAAEGKPILIWEANGNPIGMT